MNTPQDTDIVRDRQAWEKLVKHLKYINSTISTYVGDTFEEYEALTQLADRGILWERKPCGPCGGGAITEAIPNPYAGAFPIMGDPESKNTVGSDGDDTALIISMHNRAVVKLYLSMKDAQ